jgi:hypothetical protein
MLRLSLVVALIAMLSVPVMALTGARQGCLAVFNNSSQDITVYLKGSSEDDAGPWALKAGVRAVLSGSSGSGVVVSKQTVAWAETEGGAYQRLSLLADPSTYYDGSIKRQDCPVTGMWLKPFIQTNYFFVEVTA